MPLRRYIILRKAVQLSELQYRMQLISDMNAAFNGNQKHTKALEQQFQTLQGSGVKFEGDKDWVNRLKRFGLK